MKKVFVDTNVFLRYFVPEDNNSFEKSKRLFEIIESGGIIPYTSCIVILEIIYVLMRSYKFSFKEISSKIPLILKLRNLIVLEKTNTKKALELYLKHNIKFGDCLIATQIPKGVILCTYDEEFKKIPGLISKKPQEIIFAPNFL
jgi:predicted nucleic acid-binding protein